MGMAKILMAQRDPLFERVILKVQGTASLGTSSDAQCKLRGPVRRAGMQHSIRVSLSDVPTEVLAGKLDALMIPMLYGPCLQLYHAGDRFRGILAHLENGKYVLRSYDGTVDLSSGACYLKQSWTRY